MLRILQDFCTKKSMISIYTNFNDSNKFHYGMIAAVDDKEIAIHMISPDGEDDGIIVTDVNKVFRVEEKGEYQKKMELLCTADSVSAYDIFHKNEDIKKEVILYAFHENRILSIELIDSGYIDVVGFVVDMDDIDCKVLLVDEYGCTDGFAYFPMKEVTQVTVLSQDEKRIERLWRLRGQPALIR